jgi:hypothetical protein
MGEASSLPQVEARAMLANGKTESPWPYYPSNDWQIYFVGHWDQKVLSGVGPTLPQHDTLQTLIGELGVKVKVPDAAAGRRAAGRDVNGFGAWRQLGLSITKELGLWGFYGIDQPNADEAKAAGFTRLRNMHIAWMASYKDGPHAIAIEFLHVATDTFTPATMTTPQAITTSEGNQPSVSAIYFF